MLKIFVEACNGEYLGVSKIYINHGELSEFANVIKGFPTNSNDKRIYNFGGELSYLNLDFSCIDKLGHSSVFIDIGDENWNNEKRRNKACFAMYFEPEAINNFVKELINISNSEEGKAILKGYKS